jgi:hypothetical protein
MGQGYSILILGMTKFLYQGGIHPVPAGLIIRSPYSVVLEYLHPHFSSLAINYFQPILKLIASLAMTAIRVLDTDTIEKLQL